MQDKIETQEEINELMPNKSCIPCNNSNSKLLRKEHNRWKIEVQKKIDGKTGDNSFWKDVSSCVAL